METPLIEFRGITKRFAGRTILDKADLTIYENQITTIIGKSGSGKSVLIKHIIGLLSPDEGSILFRGLPVQKMKKKEWEEYRSQISYMFQNNALFDSMTVFENIALPLRQTTNLKKKEIEKKVMSRIEQMELADATRKYPAELSGGMQKRVALARALVTDPAIVLFDEPTTSQDPIRRNIILSMIAHYRKKFGFTAVLISHDIPDVFFISDRILLLWEGKIAFNGSYEEFSRIDHPMIDEFIASIEGLKDELTGLLSKKMFSSRYALTDRTHADSAMTAVLFRIEFDRLSDRLGPQTALEILKTLSEYVNKHFDPLGGFSARHSRGRILTMLPYLQPEEAEKSVHDFALELQQKALPGCAKGIHEPFEISVTAGITEAGPADDIEQIVENASTKQKIIATYQCGKEDCSK
ncbi:MAG: ABC-type transport system involved in resistance to organic solvent, ATPase component [Nitrospirae bacterium]|nr:ABC-type transport system involved in resistance to organic solvent, ATPase component [Nitrospirota bacterium]